MSENGKFLQIPVEGKNGELKVFKGSSGDFQGVIFVEVRYNKAGVLKLLCVKTNNSIITKMEFV